MTPGLPRGSDRPRASHSRIPLGERSNAGGRSTPIGQSSGRHREGPLCPRGMTTVPRRTSAARRQGTRSDCVRRTFYPCGAQRGHCQAAPAYSRAGFREAQLPRSRREVRAVCGRPHSDRRRRPAHHLAMLTVEGAAGVDTDPSRRFCAADRSAPRFVRSGRPHGSGVRHRYLRAADILGLPPPTPLTGSERSWERGHARELRRIAPLVCIGSTNEDICKPLKRRTRAPRLQRRGTCDRRGHRCWGGSCRPRVRVRGLCCAVHGTVR